MHASSMLTLSESAFAYLVGAEKLAVGGNFTRRAFYLALVSLAITMVSKQHIVSAIVLASLARGCDIKEQFG